VDFVKNLGVQLGNLAARIPRLPRLPRPALRGRLPQVAAYLLYALVLAGVLLIWKFPYQSLEGRIEAAASRHLGMRVEITDLSPTFPPGLKASRCVVKPWEAGREPVFEMARGSLRFRILPLLRGAAGARFYASAYGGSLSGDLSVGLGREHPYQLTAIVQSIRLEENRAVPQLLGRRMSGTLSGEFRIDGAMGKKGGLTGGGRIEVHHGSLPVESSYLKVKSLDEVELNATMKLAGGKLVVEGCDFKAKGIQGSLKGTVNLAPVWSESVLDLAGEGQVDGTLLNLDPSLAPQVQALLQQQKALPFRLRGSLGSPQVSLF
jgi:type II secretion system protein N